MTPHLPDLLRAAVRLDFSSFVQKTFSTLNPGQVFVPDWYLQAIAYQLERVRLGKCRRLIINLPPRSLKSMTASVAWPAYLLGQDPKLRIICASYSSDLSRTLSRDFRAVVGSNWYRDAFPETRVSPTKDSQDEVQFTERGFRLATSVGGTLTGRGSNIIIIDDPLKPSEAYSASAREAANQWFANTLLSRLDDKQTGAIVIVMQRVHMNDLSGFVQQAGDDWTVLSLPAIATCDQDIPLLGGKVHHRRVGEVLSPRREPLATLKSIQMVLGGDLFSAQYQQEPVPPGGMMIKRAWVQRYTELPPKEEQLCTIQSWDTAMKGGPDNDFSVCTTWIQTYDEHWYLTHVWRGRVDYPGLKAKVSEMAAIWDPSQILVEEVGTAIGLLDEFKHLRGITGVKPDRDKISRVSVISARFEAGQVFFPASASWLPDLEAELFAFPGGSHDDQVDSISQALQHGKSDLGVWRILGMTRAEFLARGGS